MGWVGVGVGVLERRVALVRVYKVYHARLVLLRTG